jgi:hypothetical protein
MYSVEQLNTWTKRGRERQGADALKWNASIRE